MRFFALFLASSVCAAPVIDPLDLGLDGEFIPLHNPNVEGIHAINYNSPADSIDGERQIRTYVNVDAENDSSGTVHFLVGNWIYLDGITPDLPSLDPPEPIEDFFIGDIVFYDFGNLFTDSGNVTLTSYGVDYAYAGLGNTPGGTNVDSTIAPTLGNNTLNDQGFKYSATGHNGIDLGEWSLFSFKYQAASLTSFYKQIDQVFIGYHAQAFDRCYGDYSASFWTTMPIQPQPVPEPSTLLLLAIGTIGLIVRKYK